ncbi:MAG: lamin tail domain-containing protein [Phycisphaerales bacterium]|nr:lamin tail domain-containing protein [Phycisphaerales bacterium]
MSVRSRRSGKIFGVCCALALGASASAQVVISQVWGGGGARSDGPDSDLVELFNTGTTPVNLAGFSLQFRNQSTSNAWTARNLSGTIQPKQYLLVKTFTPPFPSGFAVAADVTLSPAFDFSVNRGQIALVSSTTTLSSPGCPTSAQYVDFFGYGDNLGAGCTSSGSFCSDCREGSGFADNAQGGSANTATIWQRRLCGGLTDTNNNRNDFELVGPGTSIPSTFRNASSPANAGITLTASMNPAALTPNTLSAAAPGGAITLTLIASSSCGIVNSATANLTSIGGGASVPMSISGVGVFVLNTTVGGAVVPGPKAITFTGTGGALSGQTTLNIIVTQSNDECSAPITISGASPAWSNLGATATFDSDPNDFVPPLPYCTTFVGGQVFNDAWYAWTAPTTDTYTISTEASTPANFDARLVIWDGTTCPPSTCITGNDNNFVFPGGPALVTFSANAGQQYLIQIGSSGEGQRTGTGVLSISVGNPGGACCTPQNTCVVVADQAACDGLGGNSFTFGSTCTGGGAPDCAPRGTCCLTSGGCLVNVTQIRCSVETEFLSWTLGGDCSICPVGGRCCQASGCTTVIEANCPNAAVNWTAGLSCITDPCPQTSQVCCRGATCYTVVNTANCVVLPGSGAGVAVVSSTSTCNATGTANTPCCYADYDKTAGIQVADIFAFLNDWFASIGSANTGGDPVGTPTVNAIFEFLNAWFAGGC